MNQNFEKELLKLLKQYHHYKFMTGGLFSGWFAGMSIGGFMQWLESREK